MEPTFILGLLLVGLIAGMASSIIGIGGGIIIVPALVFLFSFDQKTAQGTSLLMLALPVAAMGAFAYYKAGNIHWQASLLLACSFVIGGYLGGRWVNSLPQGTVKKIFAVFMIIMAIKYLFFDNSKPKIPDTSTVEHNSK